MQLLKSYLILRVSVPPSSELSQALCSLDRNYLHASITAWIWSCPWHCTPFADWIGAYVYSRSGAVSDVTTCYRYIVGYLVVLLDSEPLRRQLHTGLICSHL